MYDSSWEKASRSSHPNLWSPPIVTPMSRGALSETETNSSRQMPVQNQDTDHHGERLPSVDEILFKIRHQETFRPPYLHEYNVLPQTFPQSYHNIEQPSVPQWQQEPSHNNQYRYDPRMGYNQMMEDSLHDNQVRQYPAATRPILSPTVVYSPQPKAVQVITAKKRGRKKKSDTICSHCQSTQTPEWRRGPDGSRTLCNACGLFYSKLTKKFGFEDANMIFAYKKRHNEVQDRIVPTTQQKNRYLAEALRRL